MQKPPNLDPLADLILERLRQHAGSSEIILGGYFGLQHYLPFRETHDIDAWWRSTVSLATEESIRKVMYGLARERSLGYFERRFGETVSFELREGTQRKFSFQIAVRDIALDPPMESPWSPIQIETLRDNLGSKMNALVGRAAPRDFLDIEKAVQSGLITIDDCWKLWHIKNSGQSVESARQKLLLNLTALEKRRPLTSISDEAERERARSTRKWFREEFIGLT